MRARFPGDVLGFSFGAFLAMVQRLERQPRSDGRESPDAGERLVLVSPVPAHDEAGPEIRRNVERALARPEVADLRHTHSPHGSHPSSSIRRGP